MKHSLPHHFKFLFPYVMSVTLLVSVATKQRNDFVKILCKVWVPVCSINSQIRSCTLCTKHVMLRHHNRKGIFKLDNCWEVTATGWRAQNVFMIFKCWVFVTMMRHWTSRAEGHVATVTKRYYITLNSLCAKRNKMCGRLIQCRNSFGRLTWRSNKER